MAWSTRQLAELAGTSVRAVRHYHEVGLLAEPDRKANGYKRYGVAHLVRLLRIKRLTDLGFSLTQISDMGEQDEHPGEALRALDDELAENIERLQRIRVELAVLLEHEAPTDLPPEVAEATEVAGLSEADRGLIVVLSRLLSPAALDVYKEMLHEHRQNPTLAAFDEFPEDADEAARGELADRLFEHTRAIHEDHPELQDPTLVAPRGVQFYSDTLNTALVDLYNSAQLDVLRRVNQRVRRAAQD